MSSSEGPDLSVIIPTCNSFPHLPVTLDVVLDAWPDLEIIVVADAYTPGPALSEARTYQLSSDARIRVLEARGPKAHAVRMGFEAARGRIIAYLDADYGLEATAGCLHHAVRLIAGEVADCVAADRDQHDWSRIRKAKTCGFIRLTGLLFPRLPVRDTQAPLKVMSSAAAHHLRLCATWRSRAFDVELLHRLHCARFCMQRYPVRWHGQDGQRPWATAFLLAYTAPSMVVGLFRIRLTTLLRGPRVQDHPGARQ
ncbi:glycosyltransferase family 2 protein [Actinomadura gamaensis]|uniref:Glycosyltransferase family 2 protein n=1 Tax=Actinomadura gamaensis TaxID=1763541 RepID=A0ABV9UAL0_9ACTN